MGNIFKSLFGQKDALTLYEKQKAREEEKASRYLKTINECAKIVNSTRDPDVFFMRYNLMKENVDLLCELTHVAFKGEKPKDLKDRIEKIEQAAIRDMVERFYLYTEEKACNAKTNEERREKYNNFISTLEEYFDLMNEENIEYAEELYRKSVKRFI